jgi:peptidoglycan/xylan/chitin deacetylase (PgdA/CDA1 family)
MLQILRNITNRHFILPFYHAVADIAPVHLKHLYNVRSIKQFNNDINFLLKYYTPVSIEEVYLKLKENRKLPKNSFLLTFDDGLREFYTNVFPVLKEKNIPSVLFVNSVFVDNKEMFFRFKASILIEFLQNNKEHKAVKEAEKVFNNIMTSIPDLETFTAKVQYPHRKVLDNLADFFNINFNEYLQTHKPYLSTIELKELQNNGVFIGAHSVDHPLFYLLNNNDRLQQTADSVNFIKNNFSQNISAFSFPFTDYGLNIDFFNRIYSTGLVDITFGTAGIKKDAAKFNLQRIPVEDYKTDMKQILLHQYLYYLIKAPLFKNKIKRA